MGGCNLSELLPEDEAVKLGALLSASEVVACQTPHRNLAPDGSDLISTGLVIRPASITLFI